MFIVIFGIVEYQILLHRSKRKRILEEFGVDIDEYGII